MMYAAASADFVIDRKIKNLTSTCITFSQHRNPRHQRKKTRVQVQSETYKSESSKLVLHSGNTKHSKIAVGQLRLVYFNQRVEPFNFSSSGSVWVQQRFQVSFRLRFR